jgi:peroxiredoxin
MITLYGCDEPPDQAGGQAGSPATQPSDAAGVDAGAFALDLPAPDFERTTLAGDVFRLSAHRGQVVVVNFWATWCAPCRIETPEFVALQDEFREMGLLFVGVSLDEEGFEAVRPFAEEFGVNYPLVIGDEHLVEQFGGLQGLPTTFLIDRSGRIRYGMTGLAGRGHLMPLIRELLDENG